MKNYSKIILAFSVLVAPASAYAKQDDAPKDAEKLKCKSVMQLGSRIPQRICKTVKEWEVIARANEEAARSTSGRSGSSCATGTRC